MPLKYILIGIFILGSLISLIFISDIKNNLNNPDQKNIPQSSHDSNYQEENYIDSEQVQNKIDILKKRLSFKGLIQDGDLHFQNKEYTRALTKYIQVNKQNPQDQSIINKIGNIYFQLKKYDQAYKYYEQIKSYNQLDIHRAILSLFYSQEIKIANIEYLTEQVNSFHISESEKFYYINSLQCIEDYHICRQKFHEYFQNRDTSIETGSGEVVIRDGVIYDPLENINNAIINYENFQLDDLSYKAALISGAYYQNALYPIAIATSQITLKDSPDYRPLIKIIAKSYYEMGDYINAKKFLIQYNGLGDNEPEISYFLGIVHQKLREYTRSTIQLRKAIQLGYSGELDVNRRLLFNYYQLDDSEKMLQVFHDIVSKHTNELLDDDISLAIFYHILYDKIERAKEMTTIALKKFPNNEVFYGYQGWLLLQEENITEDLLTQADEVLQKGLAINDKNPMISLTLGQLEEKRNNMSKAFIYYKQTISLDHGGEYEKFAKQKIEELELKKTQ